MLMVQSMLKPFCIFHLDIIKESKMETVIHFHELEKTEATCV